MSNTSCLHDVRVTNCYIGLGVIDNCYFKKLCRKFFKFCNGHVERTISGFNYAAIGWSPHSCLIFFQIEDDMDEIEILRYLGLSEINIMQIFDPDVSMLDMSVDVTFMEEHYVAGRNEMYNVIIFS
jgi:hypothetical protein